MKRSYRQLLALAALGAWSVLGGVTPAGAQAPQRPAPEVRATPWGLVLDFGPNGGWRERARSVARVRAQLVAGGRFDLLNSAVAAGAPLPSVAAISGVLRVPAIAFRFQDRGTGAANDTSRYRETLFGATAPAGLPYSLRSFFAEVSNGLLDYDGQVTGWVTLDGVEDTYTGAPGTCGDNPYGTNQCNGIWSSTAYEQLRTGLREALAKVDPVVDFSAFDGDGNGVVDFVLFLHSEQDGACVSATNNHIWAHRASGLGFVTDDGVTVSDYIVQSAVGGATGCEQTQVMAIGTAAHESGHVFGLPDLYDTSGEGEGIGHWGLMGSGNWATPNSPAHMEAWSRNRLGWITVVPLTTGGVDTVGPSAVSDTAFLIGVAEPNPRNESFLVENRQGVLSDSALLRVQCAASGLAFPVSCTGGLALWHIDGVKSEQSGGVNVGAPQGVKLVQADGLGQLQAGTNRGDAGDVYPGSSGNAAFGPATTPAAVSNDGAFVGFQIDSVRTLAAGDPASPMSFRLRFGGLTIVRAIDTLARVTVDGVPYGRFADLLDDGTTVTIGIDSAQLTADGARRFVFESWSDGGARVHQVTGSMQGDSVSADVSREFRLRAVTIGNGVVSSDVIADPAAGGFVAEGGTARFVASPAAGSFFEGWTGDAAATGDTLTLPATRPYDVVATFVPTLVAAAVEPPGATMGASYVLQVTAAGGVGTFQWALESGTLPAGLVLRPSGRIEGVPEVTGGFPVTLRVTSGRQSDDVSLTLSVAAPQLVTATVLATLLDTGGSLSADERRYLDLIGNRNGNFDLGDFLAFVQQTGGAASAEAMAELLGKGGAR